MLREIVKPKTNEILIKIPEIYVNRKLELILFEIHEGIEENQKPNSIADIDKIFLMAKSYPVNSCIDIIGLTEGINDDIF